MSERALVLHKAETFQVPDMLRLSDKNGGHMVSITIDALTEVDVESFAFKAHGAGDHL